jgi:hypothetical protein
MSRSHFPYTADLAHRAMAVELDHTVGTSWPRHQADIKTQSELTRHDGR